MLDRSVDGLILVDTPIGAPLPVPVVAVSGHGEVEGVTNIVVDHGRAAAQALAHLRALGHRRVAFIKGQAFSSDTAVRWQTIRAAARAERMAIDPALVGQLEWQQPAAGSRLRGGAGTAARAAARDGAVRLQRHLGAGGDPGDPRGRAARAGGRVGAWDSTTSRAPPTSTRG